MTVRLPDCSPSFTDPVVLPAGATPERSVTAESEVSGDKHSDENFSIIQQLEQGEVEEELDDELLEVLGEEVEDSGPQVKVNEKLKKWWKGWMEKGLTEETRKELIKKYPRNGEFGTEAPKVNLEIQRHLTEIAKKRDEHFIQTQSCVGTALSSLSAAVSMLTEVSTEPVNQTLLLKYLWDTGKILSEVFHQQSEARKSFITPTLDKDLKPTLNASISDEWLYGQSLTEQVKEANAIVKAASTLKATEKPVAKRPFSRGFAQGNGRGPPARSRQVGSYLARKFTSVNYRHLSNGIESNTENQHRQKPGIEKEVVKGCAEGVYKVKEVAGRLRHFVEQWREVTDDKFILHCIEGCSIQFEVVPAQSHETPEPTWPPEELVRVATAI